LSMAVRGKSFLEAVGPPNWGSFYGSAPRRRDDMSPPRRAQASHQRLGQRRPSRYQGCRCATARFCPAPNGRWNAVAMETPQGTARWMFYRTGAGFFFGGRDSINGLRGRREYNCGETAAPQKNAGRSGGCGSLGRRARPTSSSTTVGSSAPD